MEILGYGICGEGEAGRYLKETLDCFKKLCDRTVICLNNAGKEERALIANYGFKTKEDNREWGLNQWRIKEDFYKTLKSDWFLPLDMDEVMETDRATLERLAEKGGAGYYCYIQNLIEDGYSPKYSFWNVRLFNSIVNPQWEQAPLHCGLAPKDAYFWGNYAPIIVKHYGLKSQADRAKKIARYEKYDPEAKYKGRAYYNWLKNPDKQPLINKQSEVNEFIKSVHFKEYKPMAKEVKYFYIRTKDGRILDVPELHLPDELLRGSTLISENHVVKKGGPVETTVTETKMEDAKIEEDIEPIEEKKEEEKPKKTVKKVKKNAKNNDNHSQI